MRLAEINHTENDTAIDHAEIDQAAINHAEIDAAIDYVEIDAESIMWRSMQIAEIDHAENDAAIDHAEIDAAINHAEINAAINHAEIDAAIEMTINEMATTALVFAHNRLYLHLRYIEPGSTHKTFALREATIEKVAVSAQAEHGFW